MTDANLVEQPYKNFYGIYSRRKTILFSLYGLTKLELRMSNIYDESKIGLKNC